MFQQFNLVNGTWDVKGVDGKLARVRPEDIKTTALFSIEGELDDISGSGQTEAVHAICSGVPKAMQKHMEAKGAGHYGIFAGKRWREQVYPEVKSFILAHQSAAPAGRVLPIKAGPVPPATVSAPEKTAVAPVPHTQLATEYEAEFAPTATPKVTVKASAGTAANATVKAPAKAPVRTSVKAMVKQPVKTSVQATLKAAPKKSAQK